jgi:hypothetical protein
MSLHLPASATALQGREAAELHAMLSAWAEQAKKLKAEKVSQEQYDSWRYYYPKYDTTGHFMSCFGL